MSAHLIIATLLTICIVIFLVFALNDLFKITRKFIKGRIKYGFIATVIGIALLIANNISELYNILDFLDSRGFITNIAFTANITVLSIIGILIFTIWAISKTIAINTAKKTSIFIPKENGKNHCKFHTTTTTLFTITSLVFLFLIYSKNFYAYDIFDVFFKISSKNFSTLLSNDGSGIYQYILEIENNEDYPIVVKCQTEYIHTKTDWKDIVKEDIESFYNNNNSTHKKVKIYPHQKEKITLLKTSTLIPNFWGDPVPVNNIAFTDKNLYKDFKILFHQINSKILCTDHSRICQNIKENLQDNFFPFLIAWKSFVTIIEPKEHGKSETFAFQGLLRHQPKSFYDCTTKDLVLTSGYFSENIEMLPYTSILYDKKTITKDIKYNLVNISQQEKVISNNPDGDINLFGFGVLGCKNLSDQEIEDVKNGSFSAKPYSKMDKINTRQQFHVTSKEYTDNQIQLYLNKDRWSTFVYPPKLYDYNSLQD
ncbi:hypothetical protein [Maridesulfovibrio sp.]|uniref:hypothetical protein n=1 Tax=Maridesulfovibrio sp. TaxID=2795000 RepID=UPI003B000AB5